MRVYDRVNIARKKLLRRIVPRSRVGRKGKSRQQSSQGGRAGAGAGSALADRSTTRTDNSIDIQVMAESRDGDCEDLLDTANLQKIMNAPTQSRRTRTKSVTRSLQVGNIFSIVSTLWCPSKLKILEAERCILYTCVYSINPS